MQWVSALLRSLRPVRRLVGTDLYGNKYYETIRKAGAKPRREVITAVNLKPERYTPDTIPTEWQAWIRGMRDEPPTHEELLMKGKKLDTLQEKVKQIEERDRQLQEKEYEEGLVAKPTQKSSNVPVGHASAPVYESLDNRTEPTTTGKGFQPGAWAAAKQKGTEASEGPGNEQGEETFQPDSWVPPGTRQDKKK